MSFPSMEGEAAHASLVVLVLRMMNNSLSSSHTLDPIAALL